MGAVLFLVLAAGQGEWRTVAEPRDLVVQTRKVEGSKYDQIRVLATSEAPPDSVCRAAFGDGKLSGDEPTPVVERATLSERPGERVSYERIRAPLTPDRDYAVRYRLVEERDGGCAVHFQSVDGAAPPRSGVVRMTALAGRWTSAPRPGGGSTVSYEVWAEPGGSLPAIFVTRAQRRLAEASMRWVLGRAAQR